MKKPPWRWRQGRWAKKFAPKIFPPPPQKILSTIAAVRKFRLKVHPMRNVNAASAFLPVDTVSGGPIIGPARKDAESEPAVTETESRDKLEALQERLETLRDSL